MTCLHNFSNSLIFVMVIILFIMIFFKEKAIWLQIADTVNREGAKLLDHWFIGSKASYVICEGSSIPKYIAHSNNIVTVSNVSLNFRI